MMPGRPTVWLRYRALVGEPSYRVEWSESDRERCRLFYTYWAALLFARRKGTVNNDVPAAFRNRPS